MQSADPNAPPGAALMSALTTEHFVLQTAARSTMRSVSSRPSAPLRA
jgi:hypothetical protein